MRRFFLIVLTVVSVFALGSTTVWLHRARRAPFSMVPLGPRLSTNGSASFQVGLTNPSRSTVECLVGRVTRNRASYQRVVLPPGSGTQVGLPLKGAREPWTLDVAYQRSPGKVEHFLRRIGARLRLCAREPARQKLESVEVAQ